MTVKVKVDINEKNIRLQWEKPKDDVFQYVIYRGKEGEKLLPLKNIDNSEQLYFDDKRIFFNTKYSYSVKYINQNGIHSIPTLVDVIYQ